VAEIRQKSIWTVEWTWGNWCLTLVVQSLDWNN